MSKPIESFFDNEYKSNVMWLPPTGCYTIAQHDIMFQGPLFKVSNRTGQLKERYFVLTEDNLFYLKSEKKPKILSVMPLKWVRVDYLIKSASGHETSFCFRFIRNMRFTDLFTDSEEFFQAWRLNLSKIVLQCDFHSKFQTIKMIGKGSFARVYLVENKETKERFAVKAFSKEYLLSQSKGKESLINEIEIMQKLKHPYIMCLEEVHESKNSVYLVLELLEGGELLNHISNNSSISMGEVGRIMFYILDALSYMNSKGIMHRDLKPDNMILKEKDKKEGFTLKLVDFGLATVHNIPEYLFKRCGTPGFVAPEVINAPSNENIHYEPKCDVFSAGVIFYILLTEKSPFDGASFKEILQKNKQCRVDFKHPKLKKNKLALELLVKMLEVDPAKRISAEEALSERFFKEMERDLGFGDGGSLLSNTYSNVYKNPLRLNRGNEKDMGSFVVRDNLITGNTRTVNESLNSRGLISSFRNVNNRNTPSDLSSKRESILKYVLVQNANQNNDGIYDSGFVNEVFDSDCE